MQRIDLSKELIIKQGKKESSLTKKILDIHHAYRPLELTASMTEKTSSETTNPTLAQQVTATAGTLAIGAGAQALGGTSGAVVAMGAAGLYHATNYGLEKVNEVLYGKSEEDVIILGLAFPKANFEFKDNRNLGAIISPQEIENLKFAHHHLCEYIQSKINRNIFLATGLIKFNDKEVSDPKVLVALLLAHKIESIFKSESPAECQYNLEHFKADLEQFIGNNEINIILESQSTDRIFLSLQTVLFKIAKDFLESFRAEAPSQKEVQTKLNQSITQLTQQFTTTRDEIDVNLVQPFAEIAKDFRIYDQLQIIKAAIQELEKKKEDGLALLAIIKKIRKELIQFEQFKKDFLRKLKEDYDTYSAEKRRKILVQLCNHTKLLKKEREFLADIEEQLISFDISSSTNLVESTQLTSELYDDDLLKDFEIVMSDQETLLQEFIHLEISQKDFEFPKEVSQYIDEKITQEKNQVSQSSVSAQTFWGTIKHFATAAMRLKTNLQKNANDQHKQQIIGLNNNIAALKERVIALETENSNLQREKQQLQEEKQQLLQQKPPQANNQTLEMNTIFINCFHKWITEGYLKNTQSYGFFSFHRHGKEGMERAKNLLIAFNAHFINNKNPLTLAEYKEFVQAHINELGGNYFNHSLKTYLLSFALMMFPGYSPKKPVTDADELTATSRDMTALLQDNQSILEKHESRILFIRNKNQKAKNPERILQDYFYKLFEIRERPNPLINDKIKPYTRQR